jgi:hypothetical protein
MKYQSYVYKVTNKITNQFYFGSRTKNVTLERHPEEDLWKYYFTSSKRVKDLIDKYGSDSFETSIIFKHDSYDYSFLEEQRLIVENLENPLLLNKAWIDPTKNVILTSFNETEEEKRHRSQKISIAKKGKSNGRTGYSHSEESKQKIKDQSGWKHTEESKKKMKGLPKSKESRQLMSMAKKGKPWTDARRQAQLNRKGNKL